MLAPATRLVLTNAIYFKGVWKHAFLEGATSPAPFNLWTGREIRDVALMHQRGAPLLDGGSFQALDLPYEGDELSWSCSCHGRQTVWPSSRHR